MKLSHGQLAARTRRATFKVVGSLRRSHYATCCLVIARGFQSHCATLHPVTFTADVEEKRIPSCRMVRNREQIRRTLSVSCGRREMTRRVNVWFGNEVGRGRSYIRRVAVLKTRPDRNTSAQRSVQKHGKRKRHSLPCRRLGLADTSRYLACWISAVCLRRIGESLCKLRSLSASGKLGLKIV